MPEAPSLAVVIPAYNAERFLERAVESVFETGYPGIEVAIVDDGSTDGTAAVAERLCRARPEHCRYLHHPQRANFGVSASRNLGIRATNSDWLALLDADDYYLPNRFKSLRQFLGERRTFDAIYELTEIRGNGKDPSQNSDRVFGVRAALTGPELLRELLQGRCWATSAITMRRSVIKRTGLFDPDKRIAEDCDLWFRLAAIGTVVPGDLQAPVSVYWRHAHNTYTYRVEHRVPLVRAMLDAWRWVGRTDAGANREVFETEVPRYLLRSLLASREEQASEVASELVLMALRAGRLGLLARRTMLRQIATLLFESILRRRPQPSIR